MIEKELLKEMQVNDGFNNWRCAGWRGGGGGRAQQGAKMKRCETAHKQRNILLLDFKRVKQVQKSYTVCIRRKNLNHISAAFRIIVSVDFAVQAAPQFN